MRVIASWLVTKSGRHTVLTSRYSSGTTSDGGPLQGVRWAGRGSSMNSTPNNALQRTRAAVSLQSVHGELSTLGCRRAPLSLGPFGDSPEM